MTDDKSKEAQAKAQAEAQAEARRMEKVRQEREAAQKGEAEPNRALGDDPAYQRRRTAIQQQEADRIRAEEERVAGDAAPRDWRARFHRRAR